MNFFLPPHLGHKFLFGLAAFRGVGQVEEDLVRIGIGAVFVDHEGEAPDAHQAIAAVDLLDVLQCVITG